MTTELITAGRLAEHLGVSQFTIRQWANKGKIPFIRISARTLRFCLEDVIAALRARQKGMKKAKV